MSSQLYTHRSKSDGDVTEDESPKLKASFKLGSSSPDLNQGRKGVCTHSSEKQGQVKESVAAKRPVKKYSAPSMTFR